MRTNGSEPNGIVHKDGIARRSDDQGRIMLGLPDLDPAVDAALRESIDRFGVLVPVVRDQHDRLLDGRQRVRLADELAIDYAVEIVTVRDDVHAAEIVATLNLDRRHLTRGQRREVVAALRAGRHSLRAIAGVAGVSEATVRRDLAGASCDAPAHIVGTDGKRYSGTRPTIVTATVDAHRVERQARIARRPAHPPVAPPTGTYDVLLVDPPWRYEPGSVPPSRAVENHYPTMPLEDLINLPVPAAADAVMFMWSTSPKLAEAVDLLGAWGFEYRTSAVWVKDRVGMGYWFRARHEHLLLGKRGSFPAPPVDARFPSVITAPRGRHSEKPEIVYELIERMCPDRTRIEMFARTSRPGWAHWGNEMPVEDATTCVAATTLAGSK